MMMLNLTQDLLQVNQSNAGEKVLNTQTEGDENFDVFLSEANFDYTGVQNTVITLGKQGITYSIYSFKRFNW
jgi:hypothetical protein